MNRVKILILIFQIRITFEQHFFNVYKKIYNSLKISEQKDIQSLFGDEDQAINHIYKNNWINFSYHCLENGYSMQQTIRLWFKCRKKKYRNKYSAIKFSHSKYLNGLFCLHNLFVYI